MGDISIAVNPSTMQRFGAALTGFKKHLNDLTFDLIKQEAALTARQFLKYSPPIPYKGGDGDTLPAKKQGEIATDRDIRSVIAPRDASLAASVDSVYGSINSFEKWRSRQLKGKVDYIITKIHQDNNIPRAYQKAKNLFAKKVMGDRLLSFSGFRRVHDDQRRAYKGRITRHGGPSRAIKDRPYFGEAVEIDQYVKKRQEMVGMLNAGWWSCIKSIGKVRVRGLDVTPASKGIPSWIKRHNVNGYVIPSRAGGAVKFDKITVVNPIGDINGTGTEANVKARAIAFRMKAIAARPYDKILKRSIDDFNSGKTNFK